MANSVTGDGAYSPNIVAGIGNTGTVSIDTGPLDANYLTAGSAMAGDGNGTITITGDNGVVNVADPGIYAYSRLLVGSGYGPYSGIGVLNVNNGGSLTSTNNAALASGSIPLGGYSNLVVGSGPNATGTVNVDGVGGFGSSILALYGGSAGFILGADSGDGTINVTNGAQFFTLTGVIGAGDTSGGSYPGGTGTVNVSGPGSEFFATTNNGNFLVDVDQAPVIYVGQNDGTGNLNVTGGGLFAVENVMGDGKSSPTLIFGDDVGSTGIGSFQGVGTELRITQYGPAAGGNRLNGDSGLIIGNAGVGDVNLDDADINILGDRANLVVSKGSYDGAGNPVAPSATSTIFATYGAIITVDSQTYGGQGGAQVTIGAQRLSQGQFYVAQAGSTLAVQSSTDIVGDYTSGRIVVGDLGSGILQVGREGNIYASELIAGARGYTTNAVNNNTDQIFAGYNAATEGGGVGVVTVDAGSSKIVITGTGNSPNRGITLGQASGTIGTLNIGLGVPSAYVASTGGAGLITVGEFGDGAVNITYNGQLRGGSIVVGAEATTNTDTISVSGSGAQLIASGYNSTILAGGLDTGQGGIVEVGRADGSVGNISITDGGMLQIDNDLGVDQNPKLVIGVEVGSIGTVSVVGAGSPVPVTSTINIEQEGALFMAPSGDVLGGAELIVGLGGVGSLTAGYYSTVTVQGDSASLMVGVGGYDGMGAPVGSVVASTVGISNGADFLVSSGNYGFDQSAGDFSNGSSVEIGSGVGGVGAILVDGSGASLTVASSSDFIGDNQTGRIVVGGLGAGQLNVNNNATVDARLLQVGARSFYDDGMGGGRVYGGYLATVTSAGTGAVSLNSSGDLTITAASNTPFGGIRIGEASGVTGLVTVSDAGSTLTSTGGAGQIVVADYGLGALNVSNYGQVQGFLLEVGRNQGSDGDVLVDGYGSQITISNEFGDFGAASGYLAGKAGTVVVGDQAGSDGNVTIQNGAQINVLNQAGSTNDNPSVTVSRYNGSTGRLVVTGSATPASNTYYSTLRIEQSGPVGDFVTSGGIGPVGPTLIVGEGGQGQATVSNQGRIELTGAAANLNIATGRRDGAGNPDTSSLLSTLSISSDADVVVDSQSYGGSQDFTDPLGGTITAPLGSRVTIGSDVGTNGFLSISGVGSTLSVISANESADDYSTGSIRVGTNGGSGAFNLYNGGAAYARGLNVGHDAGTTGTMQLNSGGSVTITGTDATRYQGISIGRNDGYASVFLLGGSNITSTGGAGRLQVGRDGGTGILNIQSGSEVNAFFADVGRGAGSAGSIQLDGYYSRLTLSDAYGSFDPAVVTGPRGGFLTVGREDGGNGDITVTNGASLNVINDAMAAPGIQGNGATLTIGRDTGAQGIVTVSGDDGMGNASYLRVQNYGRANDGPTPGLYYGPELRLGVDGALGQMFIEQGAGVFIVGEDAQVTIGEGGDGSGLAAPQSSLAVRDGSELYVSSEINPDTSLPYNAAADIVIGDRVGGTGLLEVSGVGSTVSILSENTGNTYENSTDLTFGAGLEVGVEGSGTVTIVDGGVITISGADDLFPHLTVGDGTMDGVATGVVDVTGAGSRIEILGTSAGYGSYIYGAGGLIDVGVAAGSSGRLTVEMGAEVSNSIVNSLTRVAQQDGSVGEIGVQGAGSIFNAGTYLAVGADLDLATGVFIDNLGGVGSLTIYDQGLVNAGSTFVGSTGLLNIDDSTLISTVEVTGEFQIAGDNIGAATIQGALTQQTGSLEFDLFHNGSGIVNDSLMADAAIFRGDAITIDVQNAALLSVGDAGIFFQTSGSFSIDSIEAINIVGANPNAGQRFEIQQVSFPLGPSSIETLSFVVQQATLAAVTGDFRIVSEAPGLVALTSNDVSIVEGGVDPALQILTVGTIFGGQLESALDPGIAVTSFSQQDVDDRLIRFISDGSPAASVNLSFTDSVGFVESVTVDVVTPGVPDINLGGPPTSDAIAITGFTPGAYFGYSVSGAGDINGDGIDDLIVGASRGSGDNNDATGAAFVVFGSLSPFPTDFDLTTLDGTNGFKILGENDSEDTGFSVSGVGDVNGDGIDDLIVGSPGAYVLGLSAGKAHILFGDTAPFSPTVSLGALSLADGLAIQGDDPDSQFGSSTSGGRDINNDGIADFVIGDVSNGVDIGSGAAFVIFGSDTGLTGPASTSSLDGTNGFRITSSNPLTDDLGASVAMADIDGDGIADLIVGSPTSDGDYGGVYVIKGADVFGASVDINNLDGTNGFKISGLSEYDLLGTSVSSAGDFNGDGVEDIIFGAHEEIVGGNDAVGSVYILFGVTNGFNAASFDLTTIDGTNGIKIQGVDADDNFGQSVSSVGDMNGDGFDDVLIGAPGADPYGMATGEAYLIFGSDQGFAAQQNVAALTVDQLSLITNFDPLDSGGFSTAGGFDLNGDGLTDAVVGGPNAGPMDEGAALVVFGALTPFDPVIEGGLVVTASQNQSGLITTADLMASEPDATPADLLYHAINLVGGFIENTAAPGTPIQTFTQADIDAGVIAFNKDGATETGSFDVTVTDADGDVSAPVTVSVQSVSGAFSFNLSDLDGTNGFQLNGIAATDQSGLAVSNAGDVNGDGFDDVIVGAQQADGDRIGDSGETYIVFGAAGGFAAEIELSSLDGTNGFVLTGTASVDLSGGTVSAAGDVNNDGIDDLLVGIRNADRPSFNEGEVVVIYGSTTPFPATRALNGFDGTDGTVINGGDTNSLTGASLSEAGDVNGDGIDDFIIGSPFGDTGAGADTGESYVVFGADGGLGALLDLTTLDGTNGFRIEGSTPGFLVGIVAGIGDINDDGFADLAVGSQVADPVSGADAGITYIVFGGPAPDPVFNVGALNGANGFQIDGLAAGDQSGRSVSSAGDINNDGVDDFIIGAFAADPNGVSNAGSVYVVFGQPGGPTAGAATFDLASLDGTNGFEIQGVDANDRTGYSISNIGDFDGDGIDDILISADAGDPFDIAGAGEAYIVFGSEAGFDATLNLANLDGTNGLRLNGILPGDSTARNLSAAGDVNNDGRDDIIIGAFNADPNGLAGAGQSYVVFGFGPNQPPIARDDDFFVFADVPVSGDLFADNGDDIDEDVDGDPFTLISVNGNQMQVGAPFTLTSGASVRVQSDGLFDYTANGAFDTLADGELGADTFIYTIGNADGEQSSATVNLTIAGVNDAPVANNDLVTFTEDDVGASGDLFADNGAGPDFDIDNGDTFLLTAVDGAPVNIGRTINLSGGGRVLVSSDGTIQFNSNGAYEMLAAGETARETFTYTITDNLGAESAATVNLDITGVNDAPVARDDSFQTDEETAFSGDLFANSGAGADFDIDSPVFTVTAVNGDAANVGAALILGGLAGAVTVRANGTFDYVPSDGADILAEGGLGAETFTYQITDDLGAVSTASVIIGLDGLNDAPRAANDFLRTDERTALVASIFADNGAGVDRDVDGDFTVSAINGDSALVGSEIILPSGALLTITEDGTVNFDPNGAFLTLGSGEQAFEQLTYTITDDQGATDEATLVFAIDGILDTVFGTPGDDLIRGTDEADDIDGLGGNDLITGLDGNDTIKGGQGLDIIRGGADDDSLVGGAGKDRLFGEAGDDHLEGGGGNDRLLGLAGNDTIFGNNGDDILSGGRGNDIVSGQDGDDRLRGGRDSDTLIAGDGKDRLQGGSGNDILFGQAGNDNLTGAGGADTLSGGDGIDRLFGRRGSDELTGGQGGDRFIFNLGDGSDTITDFEQGADRIRIASGVETFADLAITQVGDDALIRFGNVRILALDEDANDFIISDFIL